MKLRVPTKNKCRARDRKRRGKTQKAFSQLPGSPPNTTMAFEGRKREGGKMGERWKEGISGIKNNRDIGRRCEGGRTVFGCSGSEGGGRRFSSASLRCFRFSESSVFRHPRNPRAPRISARSATLQSAKKQHRHTEMTSQRAQLVNKQFNSPINLYSPQAIQETLDRQTQILANGAVGIDFNQLAKPANLQNSAVLRMLEEEEARQRGGQPNLKRVTWPPPPEDQDLDFVEQGPVQAKTRGIGELGSYQSSPSSGPSPQPPSTVAQSSPSPISPASTLRQPSYFQQQTAANKGWTPVTPWPSQQQEQSLQQHLQDLYDDRAPQRQQPNQPLAPAAFEAPPSTIVLRPEPPISQIPAPVYQAQPAATKAPVSGNMRGDLKWPPASVKAQVEAENRARVELARGPACRPRRVRKDYTGFFAQHALTSTYPGYRAPPGTQYFTPAYQH